MTALLMTQPRFNWLRRIMSKRDEENSVELCAVIPEPRYTTPPTQATPSVFTIRRRTSVASDGGRSNSSPGQHVVIQETPLRPNLPSDYLKDAYRLMGFYGFSRFQVVDDDASNVSLRIGSYAQQVIFAVMTTLMLLEPAFSIKFCVISMMFEPANEYSTFVHLASSVSYFVTGVYTTYLFSSSTVLQIINEMFVNIHKYERVAFPTRDGQHKGCTWWRGKLVPAMGLATLIMSILLPLFGNNTTNWTFKGWLANAHEEIQDDIYTWTREAYEDGMYQNATVNQTEISITHMHVIAGSVTMARQVAYGLQFGLVLCFLLTLTAVFGKLTTGLIEKIENTGRLEEENLQLERETTWIQYRMLMDVTKSINNGYDTLVKIIHINNILSYAFNMSRFVLTKTMTPIAMLFSMMNISKAELMYYLAGRLAEKNEIVREWIRNWAWSTGKIQVDGKDIDGNIALDEQQNQPIGIGKGSFLIQHTFHYKFLGIVGSIFFAIADEVNSFRR